MIDFEQIEKLADEFMSLEKRFIHPSGRFDNAGRWHPTAEYDCCRGIRRPSRAYPYTLLNHCRTFRHFLAEKNVTDPNVIQQIKSVIRYNKSK